MNLFIANWKMNMNFESIYNWIQRWQPKKISQNSTVALAVSFVHLQLLKETGLENIAICAQDVSVSDKGAHTGEVGAFQLKELVSYCIVGHSEKNEPYEIVMKKAKKCVEYKIIPIICFVNETKAQKYFLPEAILVWEDPKSISKNGVYNPKDPAEIKKGIELIKSRLPNTAKVIYGGSVNAQNIKDLKKIDLLDGVLVGNASLAADEFYKIIIA